MLGSPPTPPTAAAVVIESTRWAEEAAPSVVTASYFFLGRFESLKKVFFPALSTSALDSALERKKENKKLFSPPASPRA